MRWALAGVLLAVLGCRKAAPPAPPDAGVVRSVPVPAPVPRRGTGSGLAEVHDAGWRLAWISEASGQPQVVVDGAPLTRGPAAHYLGAVLPEGDGVIVTASEGGLEELRLARLDGGVHALGPSSLRARFPSVAGRAVVYESGASGLSHLVRVDLADGGATTLCDESTGCFEPALSPDGTWLSYVSSRDGDSEVYRASLTTKKPQRLTAFHLEDFRPRVSPDGQWIAFLSNREGQDRVFLVRPDGRGLRRLTRDDALDGGAAGADAGAIEPAEADATWTPDSKRVVYAARAANDSWHLVSADVATGAQTVLAAGAWDDHQPAVSGDGRFLAFVSTRTGSPEVWLMRPDGGVAQVSDDAAADWQPLFLRAR